MLPLLHTVALPIRYKRLVNFRPSEGPNDDLFAEEGAIDADELIFICVVTGVVAEVDEGKTVLFLLLPLGFLYLEDGSQPGVIVVVIHYLVS